MSVPNVTDVYIGYKITNTTGAPITDLWVQLTPCAMCNVTLSTNEDGLYHVGPLAAGAMTTVYFYVHTTAATATLQALTVDLFEGNPAGSGVNICGSSFNYTIEETIKANANKPDTVIITSGACYVMTVTGATGTIGSGNGSIMSFTPSANPTFDADGYQLTSVSIDLDGAITNDTLYLSGLSSPNKPYKIIYTFCPPSPIAPPPAVPITWISSGMQIKHTDPDTGTGGTVFLISSKAVSPTGTVSPGATLTYTITIANSGNAPATNMTLVDSIPANTTYVAGTTTLNGAAVADTAGPSMPYTSAIEVHSPGEPGGTINAGESAVVSFQVTVNNPFPSNVTSVSNFATYQGDTISPTNTNVVVTPVCFINATDLISASVCQGATANFSTTVSSNDPVTYSWELDGSPIAGATNSNSIATAGLSLGAHTVEVTVTGACGSVTKSTTLTVQAGTSATELSPQTVCQGANANFSTTASGTGPFSYAWELDGSPIAGATNSNSIATAGLSLGAHTVEVTVTGACGSVTKSTTLTVQAGTSATELSPQTVCQGATANFSTTASGTGPFSYAWELDGSPIAGSDQQQLDRHGRIEPWRSHRRGDGHGSLRFGHQIHVTDRSGRNIRNRTLPSDGLPGRDGELLDHGFRHWPFQLRVGA
ncbi:MAG: DUF11 domain-containing protein [Acidobacteria bacterium]|nr:DUF11 domain-containing protein [Acidobacteriota bacterium]